MKYIIGFLILLLIVFGAFVFTQKNPPKGFNLFVKTPTAKINNQTFKIEVAKTNETRQVGLSGKDSIPQDFGMLFPFETQNYYSFWMKNMKFPIDIIFIRGNKIVTIFQSVKPPEKEVMSLPLYQPTEPSDAVLEINAGLSEKYGFKPGDTVKIENT